MRALPPSKGVTDSVPYLDTPEGFGPLEAMRNVRPFGSSKGRRRMGRRPGMEKLFATQLAGQPQALGVISKSSSQVGLDLGNLFDFAAGSRGREGTIAGNCWVTDEKGGLAASVTVDVSLEGGSATPTVSACQWNKGMFQSIETGAEDGTEFYVAVNYADSTRGGKLSSVIMCFNEFGGKKQGWIDARPGSGAGAVDEGHLKIELQAGATELDSAVNTMEAWGDHIYVTVRERVIVISRFSGTIVQTHTLNGWSDEAIEFRVTPDGAAAYCAFNGSGIPGNLGSGQQVWAFLWGRCFRAGIMKFDFTGDQSEPIRQVPFGISTVTQGDTYYEGQLPYLRLSEYLDRAPRGAFIEALATTSDGGCVVGFSSQGYGPNGTLLTHLPYAVPYSTVAKFSVDGVLEWEMDTDSAKDSHTLLPGVTAAGAPTTVYSDIKFQQGAGLDGGTGLDPSVFAIRSNTDNGQVFTGGRRTNATSGQGFTCFSIAENGLRLWKHNLDGDPAASGECIRQAAIQIDPLTGGPWMSGVRNTGWDSTSLNPSNTTNAHTWLLSPIDGEPVKFFDLAAAVNSANVDVRPDGWLVVASEYR